MNHECMSFVDLANAIRVITYLYTHVVCLIGGPNTMTRLYFNLCSRPRGHVEYSMFIILMYSLYVDAMRKIIMVIGYE